MVAAETERERRLYGSPDVEDAGGGVRDRGVDGEAVRAVAGGVVEHVEVGGGGEELLVVGRRRRLRFRFRLVDDEPLGVAGERVEAELESAGRPGGGHSAAAEEEAESGRRWAWRDAGEEAARHRRRLVAASVARGRSRPFVFERTWMMMLRNIWARRSSESLTKAGSDGLSPFTASTAA